MTVFSSISSPTILEHRNRFVRANASLQTPTYSVSTDSIFSSTMCIGYELKSHRLFTKELNFVQRILKMCGWYGETDTNFIARNILANEESLKDSVHPDDLKAVCKKIEQVLQKKIIPLKMNSPFFAQHSNNKLILPHH